MAVMAVNPARQEPPPLTILLNQLQEALKIYVFRRTAIHATILREVVFIIIINIKNDNYHQLRAMILATPYGEVSLLIFPV